METTQGRDREAGGQRSECDPQGRGQEDLFARRVLARVACAELQKGM